jgi:dipeptidyl aminopeptidase/acylaminoacyl peptidase
MRKLLAIISGAVFVASFASGAVPERTPFLPTDLIALNRLSDPQVSPDGTRVAYSVRSTDLEKNRGNSDLYLLDLSQASAAPRQLTQFEGTDANARWSADGHHLYFLSSRSGSMQVWRIAIAGGEAQQVTNFPVSVNALKVSPVTDTLLVSMDVFIDCQDLRCTQTRLAQQETNRPSGRVYDQLFIRHWDRWEDGTLAHLFSVWVNAEGIAAAPIDLMAQMRANVPSRPLGGDEEFNFSRDGRSVVFSARAADRSEPWSTNFDLWTVDLHGGAPINLTASNRAWDTQPTYLADGSLAWLATTRPGFENDRFRVMLRDFRSGVTRELAVGWDYSPGRLDVARDGRTLLLSADDRGQVSLFRLDPAKGKPQKLHGDAQTVAFADSAQGPILALASLAAPPDLFVLPRSGGKLKRLTAVNAGLLESRSPAEFEQFSFAGAANETVYGYMMRPAGYVAGRKYPIAFVIHGGPQVAFGNEWSYRWNPKTFAGAGYAVVVIDFHGSPGYGQAFTDSISGDWGGKPLEDLKRGLQAALDRYPFLDGNNACALGASYGGFMVNWIAGNWPDRFKCLVNHDGVFDTRGMYYSSEELWFTEWENGGTYFDVPANHEKFNPALHVARWRTPMLVVQGEQDFRIPDTQGIATFTALQRRGIESRLLYFPDENHWVLKPLNSLQWYQTVIGWLDQHLKPLKP